MPNLARTEVTETINELHPAYDSVLLSLNQEHSSEKESSDRDDMNLASDSEIQYNNNNMVFIQSELRSGDSGPPSETTLNYNNSLLFNKPAVHCLKSFFEFHPKPQNADLTVKLNYQNIYFRNNKPRHWLTYDENTKKLFCSF